MCTQLPINGEVRTSEREVLAKNDGSIISSSGFPVL